MVSLNLRVKIINGLPVEPIYAFDCDRNMVCWNTNGEVETLTRPLPTCGNVQTSNIGDDDVRGNRILGA